VSNKQQRRLVESTSKKLKSCSGVKASRELEVFCWCGLLTLLPEIPKKAPRDRVLQRTTHIPSKPHTPYLYGRSFCAMMGRCLRTDRNSRATLHRDFGTSVDDWAPCPRWSDNARRPAHHHVAMQSGLPSVSCRHASC